MHSRSAFLALLATCAAVVRGSDALEKRSTCYSGVFTIIARGSEEPQGQSILEPIASGVAAAIPNSGSNEVVYPALLSFWNSVPTGVTNAQQQMQDYVASCPDGKIVLMGYSQGSYVIVTSLVGGNFSGQTFTPIASNIADKIAAVVLFGNQARLPGQGTIATGTNCATACTDTSPLALTGSYASNMQSYNDRTEEWCDANDPICCKSGTDIQAHLSYWSDNTTDTVVQYVTGKVGVTANTTSTTSASASSAISSADSSITASASSVASSAVSAASSVASSAVSEASSALSAVSSQVLSIASLAAVATPSGSTAASATAASSPASATASPSTSSSASPASNGGDRTTFPTLTSTWILSLCSLILFMQVL